MHARSLWSLVFTWVTMCRLSQLGGGGGGCVDLPNHVSAIPASCFTWPPQACVGYPSFMLHLVGEASPTMCRLSQLHASLGGGGLPNHVSAIPASCFTWWGRPPQPCVGYPSFMLHLVGEAGDVLTSPTMCRLSQLHASLGG